MQHSRDQRLMGQAGINSAPHAENTGRERSREGMQLPTELLDMARGTGPQADRAMQLMQLQYLERLAAQHQIFW